LANSATRASAIVTSATAISAACEENVANLPSPMTTMTGKATVEAILKTAILRVTDMKALLANGTPGDHRISSAANCHPASA
jgi:hypothetical protein